ncbi:hypothetical protein Tco_0263772, partial [Tanacetum coccineum]
KLLQKVRKGKPTFQLDDEDVEAQQESVLQEKGDDPDLELAKKMSRAPVGRVTIRDPVSETTPKLPEVVGKGKAIVTAKNKRDQAPHDSTTGPSSQPGEDTSEKVILESSSTSDSE